MAEKRIIANNGSSIVLYTTDNGNTQLEVKFGGSKWFANEKDDSFNSSIGQIYQTFGSGPSVEKRLPCSSFGSWKERMVFMVRTDINALPTTPSTLSPFAVNMI